MVSNYTYDEKLSLIDGVNIKSQFGAYILDTTGFLDIPKRKSSMQFNWPDEHGVDIDLEEVYYEAKDLKMKLLLKTTSGLNDLKDKNDQLISLLSQSGLRHVKLPGLSGIFPVYYKDGSFKRETRGISGTQMATLDLALSMPYPVIRNFYCNSSVSLRTVTINITTTKPLVIEWGDGITTNVASSETVSHTYTTLGHYCIIIYGGLQGISSLLVTNATEL